MTRIQDIRHAIRHQVLSSISTGGTILINYPQGTGKSVSTLRALLENNNKSVYCGVNHKFNHNLLEIINRLYDTSYHLPIIKGRNAFVNPDENSERMCINPQLKEFQRKKLNVKDYLCETCPYQKKCMYNKQFEALQYDRTILTVLDFIGTPFFNELFEEHGYEVLVIDENSFRALVDTIRFNTNHLSVLQQLLVEMQLECSHEYTDYFLLFNDVIGALLQITKSLRSSNKHITGKKFKDAFFQNISLDTSDMRNLLYNMKGFNGEYKHFLKTVLQDDIRRLDGFKDILFDIESMIRLLLDFEHMTTPFILPMFAKFISNRSNEFWFYKRVKDLPDVPTIIVDATGDAQVYQQILDRPIDEFSLPLDIQRNIIQITDGFYWKEPLAFSEERERLWDKVRFVMDTMFQEGADIIFIITYKQFVESIKQELLKTYPSDRFEVHYFGNIKGRNFSKLTKNSCLISVGTFSPNIEEYAEMLSCFFAGEEPFDTERVIELPSSDFYQHDYRYDDERLKKFVKIYREHILEDALERLRFFLGLGGKQAVMFSMLPIKFETEKMSFNQYESMHGISKKIKAEKKAIRWLLEEGEISLSDFYNRVKKWKGINPNELRDDLIKKNLVQIVKKKRTSFLMATKIGAKYVQQE